MRVYCIHVRRRGRPVSFHRNHGTPRIRPRRIQVPGAPASGPRAKPARVAVRLLRGVANEWAERLDSPRRWPDDYADFLDTCAAAGQRRPTPLLLRYGPGDYNRLHQDLYGEVYFPFQTIVLLDAPQRDFEGGELILVESRPRMQSRPVVIPLTQGDAAIIPVRERPIRIARGWSKAMVRHGVAEVRGGARRTLGVIFHDAV